MSKIYWDIHNKRQFIEDVKYYNKIDYKIKFIKKYHKYEQYIDFFPKVLKDIICEYMNDIILLKCRAYIGYSTIYDRTFYFDAFSEINFQLVHIQFAVNVHNVNNLFIINDTSIDKKKILESDLINLKLIYKKCMMTMNELQYNIICIQKVISCITKIKLDVTKPNQEHRQMLLDLDLLKKMKS